MYEGQLKAVSFLPMGNHTYPQQPYTEITQDEYDYYIGRIGKIDFSAIYDGIENLDRMKEIIPLKSLETYVSNLEL
jgi:hypothetical protein